MSIRSENPSRGRANVGPRVLLSFLGLFLLAAGARAEMSIPMSPPAAAVPALPPAAAAAAPQGGGGASADSRALRQEIEAAYEVIPLRDGVLLRPRQVRSGVRSIEVAGDAVAVNGERVSEGVLRAWLGEDAGPVLRLAALPAAERRALFDLPGVATGTAAPEAAQTAAGTEPGVPAPPAPTEDTEPAEGTEAPDVATPVPPVPPLPPVPATDSGGHVEVFGSVTVDPGETVEEVVVVFGPAHVNGRVEGDVVAVFGGVWIDGWVGGDVVSVANGVNLGPKAEVMGNIEAVGGAVHQAPGARVHGKINKVKFGPTSGRWDFEPEVGWQDGGVDGLLVEMAWLALVALLLCLTLLLGRRRVERAEARIAAEPWKSGVVGLLSVFAFWPLVIIATVLTCCLAVLLYPFIAILVVILLLLGYTAVSYRVGRWTEVRFGWRPGNAYLVMLAGFALLEVLTFVSRLIALGGGALHVVAWFFFVAGSVVQWAALFVGLGAVLIDLFEERAARRRAYEGTLPPAYPPPGYPLMPPVSPVPPASPVPQEPPPGPAAPGSAPYPPEWTAPASPPAPPPAPEDGEPR